VKLGWFRLQLNKETALNALRVKPAQLGDEDLDLAPGVLARFEAALETAPAKLTGAAG
jgi:hypothetical protein